jgi:hypothetical protein
LLISFLPASNAEMQDMMVAQAGRRKLGIVMQTWSIELQCGLAFHWRPPVHRVWLQENCTSFALEHAVESLQSAKPR